MIVPNEILEIQEKKCKTCIIDLLRYSQAHEPMTTSQNKARSYPDQHAM